MNILVVKLSSLGDVVHAMPAVQDILAALPQARIDWVVEGGFAPLVARCTGVRRVIHCDLRRWRKSMLSAATRTQWQAFRAELQAQEYDAVIDLHGLSKSALVARLARLAKGGHRFALGNRTDGAGWEPLTRWLADRPIDLPPHIHAVTRSRELCARALGFELKEPMHYGLHVQPPVRTLMARQVAILHGTSRADKEWPDQHWIELGTRLMAAGHSLGLVHGSDAEEARSHSLQARWQALGHPAVEIWPRMPLDGVLDQMATCAGTIGVDTGLSHLAVGLDLPSVQLYRHPTSWRTGPLGSARQTSVEDLHIPSVAAVAAAWSRVSGENVPAPMRTEAP